MRGPKNLTTHADTAHTSFCLRSDVKLKFQLCNKRRAGERAAAAAHSINFISNSQVGFFHLCRLKTFVPSLNYKTSHSQLSRAHNKKHTASKLGRLLIIILIGGPRFSEQLAK